MRRPRVWSFRTDWWPWPFVFRGGDEWGRETACLRVPGWRVFVWAWRYCPHSCCSDKCPTTGMLHSAYVNGAARCDDCGGGQPIPAYLVEAS